MGVWSCNISTKCNNHNIAFLRKFHHSRKNTAEVLLSVVSEKIPGDFVEVGLWRGGVSIFAKGILNELEMKGSRSFQLFDVFNEQIPLEEPGARKFYAETRPRHIVDYFNMFGVGYQGLYTHKGLLNQSLPQFYQKHSKSGMSISVLCIDVKWYDANQDALYYLYGFVPVGGYVVFSSYTASQGERAWADFKADQGLSEDVLLSDSVGGYFKKTNEFQIDQIDFNRMRAPRDCNL